MVGILIRYSDGYICIYTSIYTYMVRCTTDSDSVHALEPSIEPSIDRMTDRPTDRSIEPSNDAIDRSRRGRVDAPPSDES